ncbi:MAG TPA: hypothetical protein VFG39_08545 [Balneolaceae bacterium]|nr:hypothetical protein [Balneolaceae bacterium]
MRKSIFFADPDFPELPKYSEWGYNTFGAYYDRQPFISNETEVPLKVVQTDDKTSFVFTGQKGVGYLEDSGLFSITITVAGSQAENYSDLIKFHNTTLQLADSGLTVMVTGEVAADTVDILQGEFQFVRAQLLLVDQKPTEVILSGTFAFQALVDGQPVSVSDGRFDVAVQEYNFFKY